MSKKKKIKELEDRNARLTYCCSAYAREFELLLTFVKSSEMRYQEWTKFQMEQFKAEGNEVEA